MSGTRLFIAFASLCAFALTSCGPGPEDIESFITTREHFGDPNILREVPLENPGFEIAVGSKPQFWRARLDQLVWSDATDAYEGALAVRFLEKDYYNYLEQDYLFDGTVVPGNELWLSAMAKSWDAGKAGLHLIVEGFDEFYSNTHPGDGEWREIKVGCRVPAFWIGGKVTIRVTVGTDPQRPVLFDDVKLTVRRTRME